MVHPEEVPPGKLAEVFESLCGKKTVYGVR